MPELQERLPCVMTAARPDLNSACPLLFLGPQYIIRGPTLSVLWLLISLAFRTAAASSLNAFVGYWSVSVEKAGGGDERSHVHNRPNLLSLFNDDELGPQRFAASKRAGRKV